MTSLPRTHATAMTTPTSTAAMSAAPMSAARTRAGDPRARQRVRRRVMLVRRGRAGFTLTEVMIALAMTAFLLVGISRIFALTSATIGAGQSLSKSMRSERAVGQTLTADLLGVGPDLANPSLESGMIPLVNTADPNYAAPFLQISNFRTPAYLNEADRAADAIQPAAAAAPTNVATWNTIYGPRSTAIRGVDRNGDGDESDAGEVESLYSYGARNFRTDTFSFFSRGAFRSQTDSGTGFGNGLTSGESYVWYGHLRTYNGEPDRLDYANAYGAPGDPYTDGTLTTPASAFLPNRNNEFAEQFRLGRVQHLLVEPTSPRGYNLTRSTTNAEATVAVTEQAVMVDNDPTQPVKFLYRDWISPQFNFGEGIRYRPSMLPLAFADRNAPTTPSHVRVYQGTQTQPVYSDDRTPTSVPPTNPATAVLLTAYHVRTDVMGTGIRQMRERTRVAADFDVSAPPPAVPPSSTSSAYYWWEQLANNWDDRFYVNPFPRAVINPDLSDPASTLAINPKSLAQRQHLLAEACSQFIVEFAGDFVTQNTAVTGANAGEAILPEPDGILDFIVVDVNGTAVRQTRWYGLPRDIDGDGVIPGYKNPLRIRSTDVIPVADFFSEYTHPTRGAFLARHSSTVRLAKGSGPRSPTLTDEQFEARLGPSIFLFERALPPTNLSVTTNDYAAQLTEPAGSGTVRQSPDLSSYQCVWGPREVARSFAVPTAAGKAYQVPQLVRVILDLRDPAGRRQEPLTQEYVFPIRVTGDSAPPTQN